MEKCEELSSSMVHNLNYKAVFLDFFQIDPRSSKIVHDVALVRSNCNKPLIESLNHQNAFTVYDVTVMMIIHNLRFILYSFSI